MRICIALIAALLALSGAFCTWASFDDPSEAEDVGYLGYGYRSCCVLSRSGRREPPHDRVPWRNICRRAAVVRIEQLLTG
jgi:hypothetical protein